MKELVSINGLTKKYGETVTVNHIDLTFNKGEVFGLLGPNGAGKTTTVLMLTTYLKPDEGYFTVDGIASYSSSKRSGINKIIGYVPQEISLYEDMSSVENLMFWGKMYQIPSEVLKKKIDQVLDQVGLLDRKKQLVRQFSGGMKRRLNIAAALLHNPQFVIFDEPTVGIDPQSRNRIFDIIKSLKDSGVCVLYLTHYMEEAQLLCDRIAIMDEGNIIATDTVDRIISTYATDDIVTINVEIDNKYIESLRKDYSDIQITYKEGKLTLSVKNIGKTLPSILNDLYQVGCKVGNIDIKEPGLQQVFLKLTGKELRD